MATTWVNDEGYSEGDVRADSTMGTDDAATQPMPSRELPDFLSKMTESQRSGECYSL
jgi:hypothetical protein